MPYELCDMSQRAAPEAPSRPRGGGRRRHGDREVVVATVVVATSGSTSQRLPAASFGLSGATAHRRMSEWSMARVWVKLHRLALDDLGARGVGTAPAMAAPAALPSPGAPAAPL
ncbi:transposase [Streptomyces actinomycinicus]|uniref:Transposase n=1 Tax=Streptomyces actinomycinicus TaxID=1695166 RepID=A0A937ESD5_9ACTN|nr:transposase [Streptomyces actinomycinicus]